jgi:hypothetical protein
MRRPSSSLRYSAAAFSNFRCPRSIHSPGPQGGKPPGSGLRVKACAEPSMRRSSELAIA